ncbi:class I SAM-dependent methyltransferase [Chitinophaga skermanii]|nr:class I SAM-dependent methyltransferase [Chitinophaga skermanii]
MSVTHYSKCPVCNSDKIHPQLSAEDYTVSHEVFDIWHCDACTARFTQNVPVSSEIGRYYQSQEYISHSETKEGLVNRLYHSVRKITMRSKQNWVKSAANLKTGSLLDVGCGTGAFIHYMQQIGWTVTGLEPDERARENAAKLYNLQPLPPSTLYELPAQSFDVITMWHVLEHVHDLHQYLDQLKRLVKPGGAILIAVPNYTSLDAKHYGKYWAAYDVPRHLYHFSPKSMQILLEQHGIQIKRKHPMVFDSFYVSLLSQQYKTGKGGLIGGAWNGFISYLKALKYVDQCSSVVYECSID